MSKDFLIEYDNLSDEQLVELSTKGDTIATECILSRYKNLVRSKARMYFLVGADKEDIIQEGMIGLFKAIRDFSPKRQVSFCGFAELCIKRQIITAVKTATRQKHMPLNSYVSLSKSMYEGESEDAIETIPDSGVQSNPEQLFISKENTAFLNERMNEVLSTLEKNVLTLYMEGKSYQEIAKALARPQKSIDNALQRVKKKMEKFENF